MPPLLAKAAAGLAARAARPAGKILVGAGIVLGLALVGFLAHRHVAVTHYARGYAAALESVAAQNRDAARAGDRARGDVGACFDRGGTWNVATGLCDL